jgi:hypothetical protein
MAITRRTRIPARLGWLIAATVCTAPAGSAEEKATSMHDSRTQQAIELMEGFVERTGITSERPQQRYLWTDSFAVCNFLGLRQATGDERYERLALRVVDRVHHVLGRHRSDDRRVGWISGLGEREGEDHPTQGGLRIGKKLPERRPDDPFDDQLEWDRDGQYFHYLTRWMHALDLVARSTREPRFNGWARELAHEAHDAFSYVPPGGGPPRMYWKMSIDLSRPLVASMGQQDPLDGFVTLAQLRATAEALPAPRVGPRLGDDIVDFAGMTKGRDWTTDDPLGLGGLLMDACLVQQLTSQGALPKGELLDELLTAALVGLSDYARQEELSRPASTRLAFRELGLAIGLQAAERMQRALDQERDGPRSSPEARKRLEALSAYAPLRARIETFWLEPDHRKAQSWTEHQDINEVMLASSLAPDGCLRLPPLD